MKWLLIIFILGSAPGFSQKNKIDFSEIDRKVRFVDAATPFVLSQQLTVDCNTDIQKVRAIFRWITDNIAYRTNEPINRKKRSRRKEEEETDDTSLLKPLDERVAEIVLANKVAVC